MSEPINNVISPWLPESDPHTLAALGKLAEESGELSSRASRCIIQGISETDPDTRRTNAEELIREIADVMACVDLLVERGILPTTDCGGMLTRRRTDKFKGFRRWHKLIDDAQK